MGLLKNLLTAKVSGNVGSMNFRKRGSQTVVAGRSYSNSSKGNGASYAQRLHRCKLANLVNLFRAIRPAQIKAWQGKPENTSDFNMLVKYNLAGSGIVLSKQRALAGAFGVEPYQVSYGSLDPVNVTLVNAKPGFEFGFSTTLAETTKVSEFSAAMVAANAGFAMGDQITMVFLNYSEGAVGDYEYYKPVAHIFEITLSSSDNTTLGTIFGTYTSYLEFNNGSIGATDTGVAVFAIHTRKSASGLLSSTQYCIVGEDALEINEETYKSADAIADAVASYGCQGEVFLDPNV